MLVIWNGSAGSADNEAARQQVQQTLAGHGVAAEIFDSPSEPATAERVNAALGQGFDAIVAAGGDGTVRSVAFQLLDRDAVLGILPLGTAMNVARSLGIPLHPEAAAEILATGSVVAIDVGEVRGRPFLEIASIGLGAEVLAVATEVKEGRLRIAFDLLRRAWRYPRTRVTLELDGREVGGRAPSLAVANGQYTGRGIHLAPDARIDDGRFDVLIFEGFGGLDLATHFVRALLGRPWDPRIRRYRAAKVRVTTRRPLPVRLDSQDLGSTPVELVTRRGALRVISR
jgi:YegS/Rv2252/BmrU family lipid kinase